MYELTYIIDPNLTEADINKLKEEISNFIIGAEGIIHDQKEERRKLAYPIKNFNQGFYVSLEFTLDPEKMPDMEKKFKTEKAILRHLIIKKEKTETTAAIAPENKKKEKEKVKIEELDEKLKELLEE